MDSPDRAVDAVVIDGDRIAAVGDRAIADRFPEASIFDLRGRTLVPGFIDAHTHLCIAALHPRWADLSGVDSPEGLRDPLLEHAAAEVDTQWVRGVGWTDLNSGFTPTRHDLDALGIDRPVIAVHYSYHQCVVSTAGLDELGIGRTTPDPPGGLIERGPDGEPTGLLVERSFSSAHEASMAAYRDPDRWADHIVTAATALLADGITCVHDAACPPSAEAQYTRLARQGRLPVSVLMMPHGEALLGPLDEPRLDRAPTGDGDEWLRVGAIKLFADGGVAPAIEGHVHGHPISMGLVFDGLAAQARRALERGFRVAVHAIGNGGLRAALEAFEAAAHARPDDDHRFRVEHATLASHQQVQHMAMLGAVAVVQPGFVHHMGGAVDGFVLDDSTWMPFADLAAAGVPLAGSSDHPCAFSEPLLTSARGVTRCTSKGAVIGGDQSVPYEDWLHAYTAGAAYAGGQEHERGRLAPGLRADLVVLDGALEADRPPSVAETWVAGERAYIAPT